jgi:hypothetical protein
MKRFAAAWVIDLIILMLGFMFLSERLNHFLLALILAVLMALPDLFITRAAAMRNGRNMPFQVSNIMLMIVVGFAISLLLIPGVFGMQSMTGRGDWVDHLIHATVGATLVAAIPMLLAAMRPKAVANQFSPAS